MITVTVTRDSGMWVAMPEDLPSGVVGAMDYSHFDDMQDEYPEFLAELLDVDKVEIIWRYVIDGRDVTDAINDWVAENERLRAVQESQERARNHVLRAMAKAGVPQRAMADVVGVSHQRVNQLINS